MYQEYPDVSDRFGLIDWQFIDRECVHELIEMKISTMSIKISSSYHQISSDTVVVLSGSSPVHHNDSHRSHY